MKTILYTPSGQFEAGAYLKPCKKENELYKTAFPIKLNKNNSTIYFLTNAPEGAEIKKL